MSVENIEITFVDNVIIIEDVTVGETNNPPASQMETIINEIAVSGDYNLLAIRGVVFKDRDGLYDKVSIDPELGKFLGWERTNRPTLADCFS